MECSGTGDNIVYDSAARGGPRRQRDDEAGGRATVRSVNYATKPKASNSHSDEELCATGVLYTVATRLDSAWGG